MKIQKNLMSRFAIIATGLIALSAISLAKTKPQEQRLVTQARQAETEKNQQQGLSGLEVKMRNAKTSVGKENLLRTNQDAVSGIKILEPGMYVINIPQNIMNTPSDRKLNLGIKVGLCKNQHGIMEAFYTPNATGKISLNLQKGTYVLRIIRTSKNNCPTGFEEKFGVCLPKTVVVNGKHVYISCGFGGMQYNEIQGDGTFGATVQGPQSGQACTGNWVHETNIRHLFIDPVVIREISSPANTRKGD
jgi:hypothetical protein